MSRHYESEWQSFTNGTCYPFMNENDMPYGILSDITITANCRVFLTYVSFAYGKATFVFGESGVCTIDSPEPNMVYEIKNGTETIGYLRLGENIPYSYARSMGDEGEILPSRINWIESVQSIVYDINGEEFESVLDLRNGYNMDIKAKENGIEMSPTFAAGIGPYCRDRYIPDAVYSINSVFPNIDGKMDWEDEHFFVLSDIGNEIFFDLMIPEERLLCTRSGFKGPNGFQGPMGPSGEDGVDAPEVSIEYNKCKE